MFCLHVYLYHVSRCLWKPEGAVSPQWDKRLKCFEMRKSTWFYFKCFGIYENEVLQIGLLANCNLFKNLICGDAFIATLKKWARVVHQGGRWRFLHSILQFWKDCWTSVSSLQVPGNRGMQACRLQVSRAVVGGSGSSDGQSGDSSFRVAELSASADSGHVEH
jgi:hypothetical protein